MYTCVEDYLPRLQKMFPKIDKRDIKRMVEYGWRMFYFYNLRGCDTLIESTKHKYWMYCGQLCSDSLKHFDYYRQMLRRKLRVLYAKKKIQWDGYYYTALSEEEYNDYIKSIKGRGRKRKYFKYNNKLSFKIFDEAKVYYSWAKYIIKFKYITDMGYSFYKEELKCTEVSLALVRECPDTFKEIMISSNNYDLI